jgi:hypothetical protein
MTETKKRPRTEAQIASERKYAETKARFVGLKLNITTDADIVTALENEPNMQAFIKQCIREHLAK